MGQADYYAVIYGVKNADSSKMDEEDYDKVDEYNLDGKFDAIAYKNTRMEVRIRHHYESEDDWIGIVLATDDSVLNNWWSAGNFDEIKLYKGWLKEIAEQNKVKLKKAKEIWNKIEPFLLKKGFIKKEDVGVYLIKDYD